MQYVRPAPDNYILASAMRVDLQADLHCHLCLSGMPVCLDRRDADKSGARKNIHGPIWPERPGAQDQ